MQPIGEHMPTDSPIGVSGDSVTRRAAAQAYEGAGIGSADLNVVDLQDTDSGTEIIATEEIGLCAVGQAGRCSNRAPARLGGRMPVNPSGGLLSKGEPVGASGLGQVFEIVNQLRGRCGPRQVPGSDSRIHWARAAIVASSFSGEADASPQPERTVIPTTP